MSRPSRRRKKKIIDLATGIALALVGLVAFGALLGGWYWLKKSDVPLDAETNCPTSGPRAVHILLFDQTDPISGQQAQRIRQEIDRYKHEASFGYRFDVYSFNGDSKNTLRPVLQVCSPGNPAEASEWISNPEQIRKQYEERFSKVLGRTIDDLLVETSRENSPLIESLRAAAISSFGGVLDGKIKLKVTLISDLVQHSAQFSQFKTESDFAQLSRSRSWPLIAPNLKRADVDVLYLLRPNAKRQGTPIQNRGHQLFWEQLIAGSNGKLMHIEPI